MADLVPTRSQNQQVLDLAANIKKAQDPGITQISSLLQRFGKSAPSAGTGMGHGIPAMMSPEQMSSLARCPARFRPDVAGDDDQQPPHRGHRHGRNRTGDRDEPGNQKLADNLISSQQSEIDQAKAMLGQN